MLPDEEDEYDIPVDQMDGMGDGVDAFANVGQGLVGEHKTEMLQYWQRIIDDIERISDDGMDSDVFKSTVLPLARIKKVMKTDSEVRMISAEAPILFAKGCDIFITELTMRAWIHAEENKRRTLQRSDIATAIQRSDIFDFLIDIVPREEAQPRRTTQRLTEYHAPESVVPPPQEPMQGQTMLGQIPGATNPMLQMPGQILGQIAGQMQSQVQGQMPGQLPGQMPGQMPNQTPHQMPNGSNQKLGQISPNQNQLPPHMAGQMMNMPPIPASLSGQVPAQSMANLGTLSDVAINTLDLSTMNMGNLQMPPENMSLPAGMSGFNGAPSDPRLQELNGQRPDQPDQRPNELSNPDISDAGTEPTESNAEAQRAQKKQKPNDQSDGLKLERKDDNFPGSPRYESAELQFSPSYQPDGVDVGAYQEY